MTYALKESHSLVQPAVEGQVDEPLGLLGVRPPAGNAAGVVIVAAQGLQRDGLCPGRSEKGSSLSPPGAPCHHPFRPLLGAWHWGRVTQNPLEAPGCQTEVWGPGQGWGPRGCAGAACGPSCLLETQYPGWFTAMSSPCCVLLWEPGPCHPGWGWVSGTGPAPGALGASWEERHKPLLRGSGAGPCSETSCPCPCSAARPDGWKGGCGCHGDQRRHVLWEPLGSGFHVP